ncbi:polysaccharide biosynthesis/export family protein [Alloacidobacterium dinghuense]|uniref:Polysaccharide biosynthesis/export family protein n=1 Tax=Alloacidobacterium dinghuense TaxID=2763107 RepID=A0A7G8BMP2_9BACT|nr:polysaccharide biosynthesis/export family protein [Alloacidobacterium dinghuense]QNI33812.1 polysaccharide biosynthesis/export family protein [Alloacidobacterium dinghuense]
MKKSKTRDSSFRPGIAFIAFLLLTPQLGFSQQPTPGATPDQRNSAPNIAIGAGDLLSIVVFDTPELTTSARVSQDGEVNLPVLGMMRLAGMNTIDAARRIEDELRSRHLILDPHVTVFISEYASQGATVMGEVRTPGVYPTLGTRKMLDMISVAGGLQTTAGKTVTIVHRDDPQHPVNIALQSGPANMSAQENPVILPGDTMIVAKAGVVYVIGDVLKPGGFLIDNNTPVSVMQSLSLAGGWDKTAALSKTKLIRKTSEGREEVDLDLKHVAYGSQADISVKDGDILFVPSSISKTLTYRGIEAAISITSGVLIYTH